jgi:hypothetical protein
MSTLILLIFFSACTEEIKNPCEDNTNIIISVLGQDIETCEGITSTEFATGANIMVIHYDVENADVDTFITSTLDGNGKLDFTIPNSQCGINNVKFIATYNSQIFEDSLGFMCCDTSFIFKFEQDCEEITEQEISCESLDAVFDLNLANQYKGCLTLSTLQSEIRWNSITINNPTENNITIDLTTLDEIDAKFSYDVSPSNDTNPIITLSPNTNLYLSFYVDTDEEGEFYSTIILPTTCTDSLENLNTGEITINLTTEICEDYCTCPFSNDGNINQTITKLNSGILVGTSQLYSDQMIFEIENGMLDENCYMNVTSIERFNSDSPATSIQADEEIIHDWTITSSPNLPQLISLGDQFNLSATFTPETSGESADTFEIFVDVYNQINELKESCSFIVVFNGLGCENICPQIAITLPAQLVDASTDALLQNLYWGDVIDMNQNKTIKQSLSGNLGNLCQSIISGEESTSYLISIPDSENVVMCSNLTISVSVQDNGITGDKYYFDVNDNSFILAQGQDDLLIVQFNTPNIKEHLQSNHGSYYKANLVLTATDGNGNLVAIQNINLEAEVYETSINISETKHMKAFSQISDKESSPAYQAYTIETYDTDYYYFGKVDNLDLNHIDTSTDPYSPLSSHSFYFEVDNPKDIDSLQYPKLYLVKNNGESDYNKFSRITGNPVANYSSNSEFSDDLDNLVSQVFQSGLFYSRGNAPTSEFNFTNGDNYGWIPYRSAENMASDGIGTDINLGDVFIIWNPNGSNEEFTSNGDVYSSYCDVAFLYIDEISDGSGTNSNIGSVGFYVAFPLSVIKE